MRNAEIATGQEGMRGFLQGPRPRISRGDSRGELSRIPAEWPRKGLSCTEAETTSPRRFSCGAFRDEGEISEEQLGERRRRNPLIVSSLPHLFFRERDAEARETERAENNNVILNTRSRFSSLHDNDHVSLVRSAGGLKLRA